MTRYRANLVLLEYITRVGAQSTLHDSNVKVVARSEDQQNSLSTLRLLKLWIHYLVYEKKNAKVCYLRSNCSMWVRGGGGGIGGGVEYKHAHFSILITIYINLILRTKRWRTMFVLIINIIKFTKVIKDIDSYLQLNCYITFV